MQTSEYQIELVKALQKNEELMCDLYKIYAEKFPDYEEFWVHIAHDELAHAEWINNLLAEIETELLFINENRFQLEPIKSFSEFVTDNIKRAKTEELKLINALSISLDVENGLIEKKFFEIYETDSTKLKHILSALKNATELHIQIVKKHWLEEREKLGIK